MWLEMDDPDINWVTKCIFFYYPECREYFLLLRSFAVSPFNLGFTVGPPEVMTGEPLNYIMKSLRPIKFLDFLNSLILYFIKNTTLGNPTTLLVLLGLPYVSSITIKFDKTPAHVPLHYYNFLDVFREIIINTLPLY